MIAPVSTENWNILFDLIHRGLMDLPASEWWPYFGTNSTPEHRIEVLQGLDIDYSEQLDEAVQQWCSKETWPELLPPVVYALKQRTFAAYFFASPIVIQDFGETKTIVPFPAGTVPEVALWYLSEWWENRGLFLLAEYTGTGFWPSSFSA